MDLVLGIDLGTSYFKCGLFDHDGGLRGLGRKPTSPTTHEGGRIEVTVAQFYETLQGALREAIDTAGAQAEDIRAISYSSQANTFVLLDADGQALTPFVLWTDHRMDHVPEPLAKIWSGPDVLPVTGLPEPGPMMAPAKAAWFREHQPEVWAQARQLLTISSYLGWALTGEAVTDAGSGSLLGLIDLQRCEWWEAALQAADLDASFLGRPAVPGTPTGKVTAEGTRLLGIAEGTPFVAGSLDHYAAALGVGMGGAAPFSASIGTVIAVVKAAQDYTPRPECLTGRGVVGGPPYCQLTYDMNGAGVLEWYRNTHAPEVEFTELSRLAAQTPPGADGLRARPSPQEYPELEGFTGRRETCGHGHYTRAIMESTAATMADLCAKLSPDDPPQRILATGGGARSDIWLQIMADVTGACFLRVDCPEPACLGAAMMAATACGWFESAPHAAAAWTHEPATITPDPAQRSFYSEWLSNTTDE